MANFTGGSVADLFATLGLDASMFDAGVRDAKANMAEAARAIGGEVNKIYREFQKELTAQPLKEALRQLKVQGIEASQALDLVTEASRRMAARGAEAAAAEAQLNAEFMRAVKNRNVAFAAEKAEEVRIDREAARMEAGFDRDRIANMRLVEAERARANRLRLADVDTFRRLEGDLAAREAQMTGLDTQFRSAMNARDTSFAQQGQGGMGTTGRMVTRMATVAAIYGAARFVGSALQRPIDIERQSEQTGFSVEGTQRLQYAAARTNTPVEALSGTINRLQTSVEALNTATGAGAEKARRLFRELGVGYSDLKTQLETNPEKAVTDLVTAIEKLDSAAKRAEAFRDLFGGRGMGRTEEALKRFAQSSNQSAVLIQPEVEMVSHLAGAWNTAWLKAKDYSALFVARGAMSVLGPNVPAPSNGISARSRALALASRAGRDALSASMPGEAMGINPLDVADVGTKLTASDVRRDVEESIAIAKLRRQEALELMNLLAPEGQRNVGQYQAWVDKAQELYRVKAITKGQLVDFKGALTTRFREDQDKSFESELSKSASILDRFGAHGKSNAELVAIEFQKLKEAFDQGRISLADLTEATRGYYSMVSSQAEGKSLAETWKLYEQGLASIDEVNAAIARSQAHGGMSGFEQAYERGDINSMEMSDAARKYRSDMLYYGGADVGARPGPAQPRSYAPAPWDQPSAPSGWVSPSGIKPGMKSPQADLGGTINVIAMDEFSEKMINRWKREGMFTG